MSYGLARMKLSNTYNVIGLMSGTSLDGLDMAYCTLTRTSDSWRFKIHEAITIKYSFTWKHKLSTAHLLRGGELLALDVEYGKYLGEAVKNFIQTQKLKRVDFISSHGHTVFHQPERGFTFQLGQGNALREVSGLPVVYYFRSLDVSYGGQGAPLVPIGDRYLFGDYDYCVNLGGIGNISMEVRGKRIAFDFCFVNMGLNYLAAKKRDDFDKDGQRAKQGKINVPLLTRLNKINRKLRKKRPSLGREFFEEYIKPLLDDESISIEDKLRTCCESVATEFDLAISPKRNLRVLVTGGGVLNSFLMDCIKLKVAHRAELIVPPLQILKFKEALIFAFLGVLRVRNEINSLKSVTGANRDSSGGIMTGF